MLQPNRPDLLSHISDLRKYCLNDPLIASETTTNQKSEAESFALSEIEMVNFHRVHDEDLEAVQTLHKVQATLKKYQQAANHVRKSLDHLSNFLQNFQLLGQQFNESSLIAIQSYKYCAQHITNSVFCLKQTTDILPQNQTGKADYRAQFEWECTESILENIGLILDRLDEQKRRSKIGQSEKMISVDHNDRIYKISQRGRAESQEVEALRRQVQEYQEERQTFIRIHEYYQEQLKKLQLNLSPEHQEDQESEDEDLPTFNYGFEADEKRYQPAPYVKYTQYDSSPYPTPTVGRSRFRNRHRY